MAKELDFDIDRALEQNHAHYAKLEAAIENQSNARNVVSRFFADVQVRRHERAALDSDQHLGMAMELKSMLEGGIPPLD